LPQVHQYELNDEGGSHKLSSEFNLVKGMIILVFKKFIHNSHNQRLLPDAPLFTTSSRRHSRKNINFHRINDRSLTPPSSSPPPTTHGAFVTINMRRSIHFSMHLFHHISLFQLTQELDLWEPSFNLHDLIIFSSSQLSQSTIAP
jgi:hypothetical protein